MRRFAGVLAVVLGLSTVGLVRPPSSVEAAIPKTVATTSTTPLNVTEFGGMAVDPVSGRMALADADHVNVYDPLGGPVGVISGVIGKAITAGPGWFALASGTKVRRFSSTTLAELSTVSLPSPALATGIALAGSDLYVSWRTPTYATGLSKISVASGAITSWPGVSFGDTLRSYPDRSDRILSFLGPVDVTTSPPSVVVPSEGCEFAATADVAAMPGTGEIYTAIGWEYFIPERVGSTLCRTGLNHATSSYPTSVDATDRFGKVVAAGGSYFDGFSVLLFRPHEVDPFLQVAGIYSDTVQVRLNPVVPVVYALSRYWTGTPAGYLYQLNVVVYDDSPRMFASSLAPDGVPQLGGSLVTIAGYGLKLATSVTVDGVNAPIVSNPDDQTLVVRVPPHAQGAAQVVVTSRDSTSRLTLMYSGALGSYGEYHPITPFRLADTRSDAELVGGQARSFPVAGHGGVPANDVLAVVANVTVTEPVNPGYLTVFPAGTSVPVVSNLNFEAGQTVPNLVTVRVGTGGAIQLYSSVSTHAIIDVVGWYGTTGAAPGSRFHPMTPVRVLDTRGWIPLGPDEIASVPVKERAGLPASTTAVVLNVTAVAATLPTFVTVFPGDEYTVPPVSNLNPPDTEAVPNLVIVRVGGGDEIHLYNAQGYVQIIVDVVGWFDGERSTEQGRFVPLRTPTRFLDTRPNAIPGKTTGIVSVAGRLGVPAASKLSAVSLNATVTGPTMPLYVTAFPGWSSVPSTSTLNAVAGQTVPNHVIVGSGALGAVSFYVSTGSAQLVVDVNGWFTSESATADDIPQG